MLCWREKDENFAPDCKCFCRRYDMDLRDERELAYQKLLRICQAGFLSIMDFK